MATLTRQPETLPEPSLADVPQVRFCLVNVVLVAVLTGCHVLAVGATAGTVVGAVVVVASALVLPTRYVAATAVVAWAWVTGFLVNDAGVLTFGHHDLLRLAALLGVALLGATLFSRTAAAAADRAPGRPRRTGR